LEWMVVSCDFDGIQTAGVMQVCDFDPDIDVDVFPGITFATVDLADAACIDFARETGLEFFGNLVPAAYACPGCGERHLDKLIVSDDVITCAKCGTKYELLGR
jgi:DNA-directed RNA polymerase subunit RPC12/RpoP